MEKNDDTLITFIIIASLLYLVEGAIPRPLPWMKLGLANIITIVIIYYFDFIFLLKFIFFRIIIGNLITGTIFTPSFFLSLSGSITSGLIMFFLLKILKNYISAIGLSIAGATIHLISQTFFVYLFFIHDLTVLYILPVILITGLITGTIIGYITEKVLLGLKNSEAL